jgi:histidinol dehydrogenase
MTTPLRDGRIPAPVAAAALISGVDRVFLCGGAQAIAALAYGTETIPQADVIAGPGNIFVATAKRLVYGNVDIDMIAGPSEVLVIADENANPEYIAADLLSQAEHDALASGVLVTNSEQLAQKVSAELERQLSLLERNEIAGKSVNDFGAAIVCPDMDSVFEVANMIAPEHLEVLTKDPMADLEKVENAGSIFLGEYSPEPLGDYFAGTNHVLPTNGTARFASPLSVDTFIKKSGVIFYSREGLEEYHKDIIRFAESEGLTAHANSVRVRFK